MDLNESLENLDPEQKGIESLQNRRKLQTFIDSLYKRNFNKLDPMSIKYLEFKSFHHITQKEVKYLKKKNKPKDLTIEYLKRNHVSTKQGINICELPKSPWGKHRSYNTDGKFSNNHFKTGKEDDSQMHNYNKKLRMYKKIVNKVKNKDIVKTIDYQPEDLVFKTPSGNMHCKKDREVEFLYEKVNEKFRKIRLFTFDNTEEVKKKLEKQTSCGKRINSSEVTNRLYTPVPKVEKFSYITEKYKDLWIQDT